MTDLEKRIKAKIAGDDTGIEIKQTVCDICTPLNHCGIDAYIKDGKVIKIEGTKGHPMNDGKLCTKGACNREYIYRKDRIKTPLKRTGERGEGKFEPISWKQAYAEISKNMLSIKEKYGPDSVMFFSGYAKSYRFMLQRLAHAFGSVNYSTESSACFTSSKMAWLLNTGKFGRPDMMNANLFVAWGSPTHYARYTNGNNYDNFHKRGGKIISIDPRRTPISERDADLHLRVRPGTDGLLANAMAGYIIKNNLHDKEYIEKYVHGFEEYKKYVCSIDLNEASKKTGVPAELIKDAAEMIATIRPMSLENNPTSVIHQTNGLQTVRAITALSFITGNYNTPGGNTCLDFTYCEQGAGFKTEDEEFAIEHLPEGFDVNRVGAGKYPVWNRLVTQAQACDMMRQINEEKPYPIKCIYAHGMNHHMFPNKEYTEEALKKVDFFVDTDLFMTDTVKFADIVLPVCSSFEREEFKVYPGGFAKFYAPVIEPLFESRSDYRVISELSVALGIEDEYLKGGYRKCVERVLEGTELSIDEMINAPLPVKVETVKPEPLGYVNKGCLTPTGKIEIYSEVIKEFEDSHGLNPLPVYDEPAVKSDEKYPFTLQTGVRIPNAIHTRLHNVSWARAIRPDPMADISVEDAERLSLSKGDEVRLFNENGEIKVQVNPTIMVSEGQIYMYHGYSEADVARLLYKDNFDSYSGFPAYKGICCGLEKLTSGPGMN